MKNRIFAGSILGSVLALVIFFAMYISSLRSRAQHIIDAVGLSSAPIGVPYTVESLRIRVGVLTSGQCSGERCYYETALNNNLLATLHLASFAEIRAGFYFNRGNLAGGIVDYRIARRHGNSPVVHVQNDGATEDEYSKGLFAVHPHGPRSTELWNGIVELNATTPVMQREAARSFNLDCFSVFSHCSDVASLMPKIWSRNSDGTIRCRFKTSGDAYNEWGSN